MFKGSSRCARVFVLDALRTHKGYETGPCQGLVEIHGQFFCGEGSPAAEREKRIMAGGRHHFVDIVASYSAV
jgi:hypothetical protein